MLDFSDCRRTYIHILIKTLLGNYYAHFCVTLSRGHACRTRYAIKSSSGTHYFSQIYVFYVMFETKGCRKRTLQPLNRIYLEGKREKCTRGVTRICNTDIVDQNTDEKGHELEKLFFSHELETNSMN